MQVGPSRVGSASLGVRPQRAPLLLQSRKGEAPRPSARGCFQNGKMGCLSLGSLPTSGTLIQPPRKEHPPLPCSGVGAGSPPPSDREPHECGDC